MDFRGELRAATREGGNDLRLDLDVAFPTTPEDIRALRAVRAETPSWLDLSHEELEALLPESASEERSPSSTHPIPFTLEP